MSKLVDERVVQLGFDNKSFEKNVKTSISTIDRLKSSLDFSDSTNSINKSFDSVNVNNIIKSLEKVNDSFSAWQVMAISALSNITNRVTNMGVDLVKSLSVDNIASGWEKFGEKTTAVATLRAQGYSLEEVNAQLEKLQFFTDETSYTFTDMVSNIGKFTAAGQELDDSVEAMMGIANWAALSGQNATTASRAMYQLSQAMASGVVRKEDYKSIQTANMDTVEFKQNVLDVAKAMGKLERTIDGSYLTSEGHSFTIDSFTEYLTTDAWFTSDVLMETLKKYSSAVDDIFDAVNNGEYSTASEAMEQMGDSLDEFGLKAFQAAQEARTFEDVLNSVKEAVGSKWSQTFELIFGSYDDAKVLWTTLANELYDVFAAGGDIRNELFSAWNDLGGRDDIFANTEEATGAFWNLYYAIVEVVDLVKSAWDDIFPYWTGERLKEFTGRLKELSEGLYLTEDASETLANVARGAFSVVKFIIKAVDAIWTGLVPIRDLLKELTGYIFSKLGEFGERFTKFVDETTMFEKITDTVYKYSEKFIDVLKTIWEYITSFKASNFGDILSTVTDKLKTFIASVKDFFTTTSETKFDGLEEFKNKLIEKLGPVGSVLEGIISMFKGAVALLKSMLPVIGQIFGFIGEVFTWLGERLQAVFTGKDSILSIKDLFSAAFWSTIIAYAWWMLSEFMTWQHAFKNVIIGFADVLDSTATKRYADALLTFAIALAVVIAALVILASMDAEKLAGGLVVITGVITGMLGVLNALKRMSSAKTGIKGILTLASIGPVLIGFALAIGIMALSLKSISKISEEKLTNSLFVLGIMMAGLVIVAQQLSKNTKRMISSAGGLITFGLALLLLIAPLKILGKIENEVLIKGLLSISVLSLILLAVAHITKYTKASKMLAFSASMIGFAGAMLLFAQVVKIFGGIDDESLLKGLLSISVLSVLMLSISYLTKLVKPVSLLAFSASMIVLAIAMASMAGVVAILGSMSIETLAKGVIAVTAISAIMLILSKLTSVMGAVSLIAFGAALITISFGLTIFAGALAAMGSMSWETLGKGLLVVVAALGGLAALSLLLAPVVPIMIALAAAFALLGVASALIAGSFLLVASALSLLATVGTAGFAVLTQGIISLLELIPQFIVKVGEGIIQVVETIVGAIPGLVDTLVAAASAILEGLTTLGPHIFELLATLLDGALTLLDEYGPRIVEVLFKLIDLAMGALVEKGPSIAENLLIFLVDLIEKLSEKANVIVGVLLDFVIETINQLATKVPDLMKALSNLLLSLVDGTFQFLYDIQIGILESLSNYFLSLFNGLADIIDEKAPLINEAFKRLCKSVLNAVKDFFGIHSPSTVFQDIGDNVILGFIKGIGEKASALWSKMSEVIKGLVSKVEEKFSQFVTKGGELINKFKSGLSSKYSEVKNSVSTFVSELKQKFSDKFEDFKSVGSNLVTGLKNGITGAWNTVKNTVSDVGNSILNIFKGTFDEHSPSKKTYEMGAFLDEGLANGLKDYADYVDKATEDVGETALESMGSVIASLSDQIENGIDAQPTIRPVMDLSEIQNGTNRLFGMMNDIDGYSVSGSTGLASSTASAMSSRRSANQVNNGDISGLTNAVKTMSQTQQPSVYNTFNITGENAREIADEVSRILQKQVERRHAVWAQ